MGSFRLADNISHLHKKFIFAENILETAGRSLCHSCASELTRQGITLPQDRHSYSRRLPEIPFFAKTRSLFTYRHRAGLRPNTSFFKLAKSCVFSKQSPPSILIISQSLTNQINQLLNNTPYPEVRGPFCLVPSIYLPQSTLVLSN